MTDFRTAPVEDVIAAEQRAHHAPLHRPLGGLVAAMVRALPGAWAKMVPESHVGEDTASREVLVTCLCGAEARVGEAYVPVECPGDGCPRWFLFDSTNVRVAHVGPVGVESAT